MSDWKNKYQYDINQLWNSVSNLTIQIPCHECKGYDRRDCRCSYNKWINNLRFEDLQRFLRNKKN